MAHFAKLDSNNIVERIEVVHNDIATDEEAGINFLKSLYGSDTNGNALNISNLTRDAAGSSVWKSIAVIIYFKFIIVATPTKVFSIVVTVFIVPDK